VNAFTLVAPLRGELITRRGAELVGLHIIPAIPLTPLFRKWFIARRVWRGQPCLTAPTPPCSEAERTCTQRWGVGMRDFPFRGPCYNVHYGDNPPVLNSLHENGLPQA